MQSWRETLAELSRDRLTSLKRQAFLLCGNDGQAEDLVRGGPSTRQGHDPVAGYLRRRLYFPRPRRATPGQYVPGPGAHQKAAHPRTAHIQAEMDHARPTPLRDQPVADGGMDDQTGKHERWTGDCSARHAVLSRS
jgi:hypothetical protein